MAGLKNRYQSKFLSLSWCCCLPKYDCPLGGAVSLLAFRIVWMLQRIRRRDQTWESWIESWRRSMRSSRFTTRCFRDISTLQKQSGRDLLHLGGGHCHQASSLTWRIWFERITMTFQSATVSPCLYQICKPLLRMEPVCHSETAQHNTVAGQSCMSGPHTWLKPLAHLGFLVDYFKGLTYSQNMQKWREWPQGFSC